MLHKSNLCQPVAVLGDQGEASLACLALRRRAVLTATDSLPSLPPQAGAAVAGAHRAQRRHAAVLIPRLALQRIGRGGRHPAGGARWAAGGADLPRQQALLCGILPDPGTSSA